MGRVIKKALLQVSDFHFLCPSRSLPPILLSVFSSFPFCLFLISYGLSHPAISQLLPLPPLPLLPSTLGSPARKRNALGPPCDSSSDRCEDASAFRLSQDGSMSADSFILKVTNKMSSELSAWVLFGTYEQQYLPQCLTCVTVCECV